MQNVQPAVHGGRGSDEKARAGARKLLIDAAGVTSGGDLLIVNERGAFVEPEAAEIIESEARSLGARVNVVWADTVRQPDDVPVEILSRVSDVKTTIFNHRMANMLRFAPIAGGGRRINNFALSRRTLAAAADYSPSVWTQVQEALNRKLNGATRWHVRQ